MQGEKEKKLGTQKQLQEGKRCYKVTKSMLLNSMSGLSICLEQVSRKAWRLSIYHSSCAAWRTTCFKKCGRKKSIAFLLRRSVFFRQRSHTADYISAHFCRLQTHLSLFLKWPNIKTLPSFSPLFVLHIQTRR